MTLVNFTHRGLSMLPVLIPDDLIIVETEHGPIEIGDIVLFKDFDCDEFIAHRVVSLSPFMTKGDNSPIDELTNIEHVIGLVVGRSRAGSVKIWGISGTPIKRFKASLSRFYHRKYWRFFRGFFKLLSRLI